MKDSKNSKTWNSIKVVSNSDKTSFISLKLESVPSLSLMKFLYSNKEIRFLENDSKNKKSSGSEECIHIPQEVCSDVNIRDEYDRIMKMEVENYKKLLEQTKEMLSKRFGITKDSSDYKILKKRALEIAKYLPPSGLSVDDSFTTSLENLSKEISYLSASSCVVDNELATLLEKVAIDSTDNIEPDCSRANSTKSILYYIREIISAEQIDEFPENELDSVTVDYSIDSTETLISHYEALINPLGSLHELEFTPDDQENIGKLLFDKHNKNNTIGNIAQSGVIRITGFASLCFLNDLCRQSYLGKFIPILHDEIDLEQELDRKDNECYFLCDYLNLPDASSLRKEYDSALNDTYSLIKKWRENAKNSLSKEVLDEYTKYLLPCGHATKYFVYGSVDELQSNVNLMTRNCENIENRMLVYTWLKKLTEKDSLWKGLLESISSPDEDNRVQFVDKN